VVGDHVGGLATSPCAIVPFRAPSGSVVTFDSDFIYTSVTDEAAESLGTTREALLGRCCWHVYPDCVDTPIGALMREVMRTRTPAELRSVRPDRPDMDLIARAVPTPDGGIRVLFRFVKRITLSPRTAMIAVSQAMTGTR
jgi:hypothetical protein